MSSDIVPDVVWWNQGCTELFGVVQRPSLQITSGGLLLTPGEPPPSLDYSRSEVKGIQLALPQ